MARLTSLASAACFSVLLLAGCDDFARDARRDFGRLTSQSPFATAPAPKPAAAPSTRRSPAGAAAEPRVAAQREPPPPDRQTVAAAPLNLVGQSEGDILARFGPPTSQEDRTPGKAWRYRQGQCTLDVSLYPDVQTRKFTTLGYEVRSDDNTDQGRQLCLAQFQSGGRAR